MHACIIVCSYKRASLIFEPEKKWLYLLYRMCYMLVVE